MEKLVKFWVSAVKNFRIFFIIKTTKLSEQPSDVVIFYSSLFGHSFNKELIWPRFTSEAICYFYTFIFYCTTMKTSNNSIVVFVHKQTYSGSSNNLNSFTVQANWPNFIDNVHQCLQFKVYFFVASCFQISANNSTSLRSSEKIGIRLLL